MRGRDQLPVEREPKLVKMDFFPNEGGEIPKIWDQGHISRKHSNFLLVGL